MAAHSIKTGRQTESTTSSGSSRRGGGGGGGGGRGGGGGGGARFVLLWVSSTYWGLKLLKILLLISKLFFASKRVASRPARVW